MSEPSALPEIVEAVAADAREAARTDLFLAPLLERLGRSGPPSLVLPAARMRVAHGPMLDALACLPSAGDEGWLDAPEASATRARVELLLWEAGGAAISIPKLGPWLARSADSWARWVLEGARGDLLARVRAARTLEIAADGLAEAPATRRDQARRQVTLLAEHPEPLVWIPAARALGRLARRDLEAQATLTRWLDGPARSRRRRALTAAGCVPAEAPWWPEAQVRRVIDADEDPWAMAALGPAVPYLSCERRELWSELAERLAAGDPGPQVLWSVVQGLLSLALRDALDRPGKSLLRTARDRALGARARSTTEAQLWLEIQRRTDFLDGIDPDPEDLELLMRRAVRVATQAGPGRVADRMRALASRLAPAFEAALERSEAPGSSDLHAAALANLESAARAAALGLWRPVLAAAGRSAQAAPFEDLCARLLGVLDERLAGAAPDYPRHRAGLRALGLLLDGPTSGGAAAVRLLSEVPLEGNRQRGRFRKPVSDVLYRLSDQTAQPNLPDRVRHARFAAWFALAAESLRPFELPSRDSPRPDEDEIRTWQEDLRGAILRGFRPAEGGWTGRALDGLDALHAAGTPLALALEALGDALRDLAESRRRRDDAERQGAFEDLARASQRWMHALAHPAYGLDDTTEPEAAPPPPEGPWAPLRDALEIVRDPTQSTKSPRQVAEAWAEGHGPILRAPVKKAVERALTVRTSSSFSRLPTRRVLGGYKLIEPLGSGAQGEVWLVERTRVGRRFVMKLLPARGELGDAHGLEEALEAEADLLKRIYHPNVARFVDSGHEAGQPFLVLEYLIGCDLDRYTQARNLSFDELLPVVQDVGAGLEALGGYGLVHCDLKPQNVYLQLALPPERPRFDPERDRDPDLSPMLGAVVIDFGIARSMASVGQAERHAMSGTLGFLAPEQTRGGLHPKTDVYALAATVYRAMSGLVFFDHLGSVPAKLMAHGETAPFDLPETQADLPKDAPPGLADLLTEATQLDPEARPDVRTFVERFERLNPAPTP